MYARNEKPSHLNAVFICCYLGCVSMSCVVVMHDIQLQLHSPWRLSFGEWLIPASLTESLAMKSSIDHVLLSKNASAPLSGLKLLR